MKKQPIQPKNDISTNEVGQMFIALTDTIDQLAVATAKGFERHDKKFEEIIDRLDTVEENIVAINRNLFNLDERFISHGEFEKFKTKNALI